MIKTRILILVLLFTALLSACMPPRAMVVAKVERKQAPELPPNTEVVPIEFAKVSVNISRGTQIGAYRLEYAKCYPFAEYLYWNQGRVTSRNVEFADIFHEELSAANFDVVGDPAEIFASRETRQRALHAVGGQITEILMNICDQIHWWDGSSLGTQSGEASVKVKWQVYAKLDRRVVFETTTEGYFKTDKAVPDGEIFLIQQAFASAAANLAADLKFRKILARTGGPAAAEPRYSVMRFPGLRPFNKPFAENMRQVIDANVTLTLGEDHGSGFVISGGGLIVTNYHVVGEAPVIKVVLASGLKVDGKILRTHKRRDVALVQVPISGLTALPIRKTPVHVGEEVYAVGTPLSRELKATVTKGIVSAIRKRKHSGLEDIQGDVDIQPGSSGGPLLDKSGNVVGISHSGIEEKSIGINFFIPIQDALAKLNLEQGRTTQTPP